MATFVNVDGDQVPLTDARHDLTAKGRAIQANLKASRQHKLAAAKDLFMVKASGLYVAILKASEIESLAKDGRTTAWARFLETYGLTAVESSRMLNRVEAINGLVAAGLQASEVEAFAADTLKALRTIGDYGQAVEVVEAIKASGDTVTAGQVRDQAKARGYNSPADKTVTIGKAVGMVNRAMGSDSPVSYGNTTLAEITLAIDNLTKAKANLEAILAIQAEEAAKADIEDEDEDEDDN